MSVLIKIMLEVKQRIAMNFEAIVQEMSQKQHKLRCKAEIREQLGRNLALVLADSKN